MTKQELIRIINEKIEELNEEQVEIIDEMNGSIKGCFDIILIKKARYVLGKIDAYEDIKNLLGQELIDLKDLVDYLKHHIPIIIKDDKGWCNADISLENNMLIVRPNYNIPFED